MRGFEDVPSDWAPAQVWLADERWPEGTWHQRVEFIVSGKPVQKGNIVRSQWGAYHDATKGLDDWLEMVRNAARAAMNGAYRNRQKCPPGEFIPGTLTIFEGAVMVDVAFVMPRLKKHGQKDPPPHIGTPDADKLFRSVGDALTGIVYTDDKQIAELRARKRYAYVDETPGVHIVVTSDVTVL